MWRIQARHQTLCPRCRGYIKVGAWIVQDPTYGRKWSHAVCPADVRKPQQPVEPTSYEEYVPKFDDDGNVVAMERTV
jgi:hypothetical protein